MNDSTLPSSRIKADDMNIIIKNGSNVNNIFFMDILIESINLFKSVGTNCPNSNTPIIIESNNIGSFNCVSRCKNLFFEDFSLL